MINIGAVLNLEPLRDGQKEKYKCKVHDIQGTRIYIDYPVNIDTDRTAFLLDGMQLSASYILEDNAVYQFETEVLGRAKKNLPMIILHYPGPEEIIKVQRRQYVRVETSVDVNLELKLDGQEVVLSSITEDISAGGCAVLLPQGHNVKKGMTGKVLLVLPMQTGEYHYLNLDAKVSRVWENNRLQIASIQFTDIENLHQQLLFRFCFDRQLIMKRKRVMN
ncbi:flagellar brake protein [Falsibacillus pallidus]|uniref:C-di-GMP-binding flagellar brake protein YcgR n=1 Tax=Falsibacillus pallidus TaxID=493781 RepID=A0A370GGR5_9BACI|nr:flagellar brake domain-containing protein [Falsibacillus pallidus]RDI42972.1 c-di-GMP-binding flagellar brake protein YcgR [Falsibacillus pallidus]